MMRSVSTFILVLMLGGPAAAQLRCNQIFNDQEINTLDRLQGNLHDALAKQPGSAALATNEFLIRHYNSISRQIGEQMKDRRDQISSDVQAKITRLREINDRLRVLSENIQKTVATGEKFLRSKDGASWKAGKLIDEAIFCRGRGDTCSATLGKDLDSLMTYHEGLQKLERVLGQEISMLDALIALPSIQEKSEVLGPLFQQAETLKASQVLLKSQLQNHRALISAAAQQMANFDISMKAATQTLLVTAPKGKSVDHGLARLNSDRRGTFDAEVEKFEPGSKVIFIDRSAPQGDGYYAYRFHPGTVKEIKGNDSLDVFTGERSIIGRKKSTWVGVSDALLTDCVGGVCTDRDLNLQHGVPVRALETVRMETEYKVRSFHGPVRVLGFNPVTKEFLIHDSAKRDRSYFLFEHVEHFWVRYEDMVALADGWPAPSLAKMTSRRQLREGETFEWVETLVDGSYYLIKRGAYSKEASKVDPRFILEKSCAGNLCPGDVVQLKGRDGEKPKFYAVTGFVGGKILVQKADFSRGSGGSLDLSAMFVDRMFVSESEIAKVDVKDRERLEAEAAAKAAAKAAEPPKPKPLAFEAGAKVIFIDRFERNGGGYQSYMPARATIKRMEKGYFEALPEGNLMFGKVQASFDQSVLVGCHRGLCTDAEIQLRHGLVARVVETTIKKTQFRLYSFNGPAKIVGFNPEKNEFLIHDTIRTKNTQVVDFQHREHYWVRADDLVAAAAGKPVPSVVNAGSSKPLKPGDTFEWAVFADHGAYRYIVEAKYSAERGKNDVFDGWMNRDRYVFKPELILDRSCIGGLCPGDVVDYKGEQHPGPGTYAVTAFAGGKILLQPVPESVSSQGGSVDLYARTERILVAPSEIAKVGQ